MQTWVFLLHTVKFSLGSDIGQRALTPLHIPSLAQSESFRHLSVLDLKSHWAVQHGPWLGLQRNDCGCQEKAGSTPNKPFTLKPTQALNKFLICTNQNDLKIFFPITQLCLHTSHSFHKAF